MKQRAFTFVELIVTISIIAILSTLIILRISQNRQNARTASVKSNVNTVSKSIEVFKDDYEGVIAAGTTLGASAGTTRTQLQGSPTEGSTPFQQIFSGVKKKGSGISSYEAKLQKSPSNNYVYWYGSANYTGLDTSKTPAEPIYGNQNFQSTDANCYFIYAVYFNPVDGTTSVVNSVVNGATSSLSPADCRL